MNLIRLEYWMLVTVIGLAGSLFGSKYWSPINTDQERSRIVKELELRIYDLERVDKRRFSAGPINPLCRENMALDALGDGTGAILATRFSTLKQAQVAFPHARSLSDTIDWAALQSAIDAGPCWVPDNGASYVINRPLELNGNDTLRGGGGRRVAKRSPQIIASKGFVGDMVKSTGNNNLFAGLLVDGRKNKTTRGLHHFAGKEDNLLTIEDCHFRNFGREAVLIEGGIQHSIRDVFARNSLLSDDYLTKRRGTLDIGGMDHFVQNVECAARRGTKSGNSAAIIFRCGVSWIGPGVLGEVSDLGIVVARSASNNDFIGCRSDLSQTHGWKVEGPQNRFVSCGAYRNSLSGSKKYPGFLIDSNLNNLVACYSASVGGQPVHSCTVEDTASASGPNRYIGVNKSAIEPTTFNFSQSHNRTAALNIDGFIRPENQMERKRRENR